MPEATTIRSALAPKHRDRLAASAIDQQRIQDRGYCSEHSGAALGRLGFSRHQQQVPALFIPIWGLKGKTPPYQACRDRPRINSGREVRFETPYWTMLLLEIPPGIGAKILEPGTPLVINEAFFKAATSTQTGGPTGRDSIPDLRLMSRCRYESGPGTWTLPRPVMGVMGVVGVVG